MTLRCVHWTGVQHWVGVAAGGGGGGREKFTFCKSTVPVHLKLTERGVANSWFDNSNLTNTKRGKYNCDWIQRCSWSLQCHWGKKQQNINWKNFPGLNCAKGSRQGPIGLVWGGRGGGYERLFTGKSTCAQTFLTSALHQRSNLPGCSFLQALPTLPIPSNTNTLRMPTIHST